MTRVNASVMRDALFFAMSIMLITMGIWLTF